MDKLADGGGGKPQFEKCKWVLWRSSKLIINTIPCPPKKCECQEKLKAERLVKTL